MHRAIRIALFFALIYCILYAEINNAFEQEIPDSVLSTIGIFHKRIPVLELQWLEVLLSMHCTPTGKTFGRLKQF